MVTVAPQPPTTATEQQHEGARLPRSGQVRVGRQADASNRKPTDAIVRIDRTTICGTELPTSSRETYRP